LVEAEKAIVRRFAIVREAGLTGRGAEAEGGTQIGRSNSMRLRLLALWRPTISSTKPR
jgi:hypothetical protein